MQKEQERGKGKNEKGRGTNSVMNITINGEQQKIDDNCNLIDLLDKLQITNRYGMAVAVNDVVVSKTKWEKYTVQNNDNILIINAIFGG